MALTLSCVSFLNALPFVEGLRALPSGDRPRLLLDPPFRCAERLRRGEADAALVPSIEYAAMENARPAGRTGIASRHEVRSVVLLSRRAPGSLRSVAVDSNSRTSVALLRLVLAREFACRPEFVVSAPEPQGMLERCDAALLIGDPALAASRTGLEVMDLAAAWHGMTGLPFVFALWAARSEEAAMRAGPLIESALAIGLKAVESGGIPRLGRPSGMGGEDVRDYLTRNIHYQIGEEERQSLRTFFRLCREEGVLAGA